MSISNVYFLMMAIMAFNVFEIACQNCDGHVCRGSGLCIHPKQVCNGYPDCFEFEDDESDCHGDSTPEPTTKARQGSTSLATEVKSRAREWPQTISPSQPSASLTRIPPSNISLTTGSTRNTSSAHDTTEQTSVPVGTEFSTITNESLANITVTPTSNVSETGFAYSTPTNVSLTSQFSASSADTSLASKAEAYVTISTGSPSQPLLSTTPRDKFSERIISETTEFPLSSNSSFEIITPSNMTTESSNTKEQNSKSSTSSQISTSLTRTTGFPAIINVSGESTALQHTRSPLTTMLKSSTIRPQISTGPIYTQNTAKPPTRSYVSKMRTLSIKSSTQAGPSTTSSVPLVRTIALNVSTSFESPTQFSTEKPLKPEISSFEPSVGPVSGGTMLFIYGKYLNADIMGVLIANKPCNITRKNRIENVIVCRTPAVREEIKSTIVLEFDDRNVTSSEMFSYRPDPIISTIAPLRQFKGGGQMQTITGSNLDIIARPMFVVTVQTRSSSFNLCSNCNVLSSEKMTCPSPKISFDDKNSDSCKIDIESQIKGREVSYSPTVKRSVDDDCGVITSTTNGEDVTFHVGLALDDVKEWLPQNMKRNLDPNYTTYTVTEDPLFYKFPRDHTAVDINESDQYLVLQGERLNCSAQIEDITVKVGQNYCTPIISLNRRELKCKLPQQESTLVVGNEYDHGYRLVRVLIGAFDKPWYDIGYLRYSEEYGHLAPWLIALIVILVFLVVIVLILSIVYLYKRRAKYNKHNELSHEVDEDGFMYLQPIETPAAARPRRSARDAALENLETGLQLSVRDVLIDCDKLTLHYDEVLGRGSFGQVILGTLLQSFSTEPGHTYTRQEVAVKLLRNNAHHDEQAKFLEEGLLMKGLIHPNVLSLVGVCIDQYGVPMIVLPHMKFGNLKTYIEDEDRELTVKDLVAMGQQIANGMAYISDMHRMVHRDLAARNCMVDESKTVKVGDFGLSRDIYERDYYTCDDTKAKLPAKWMAPECFRRQRFDTKTDVWAFGVLLWELMTRGETPYAAIDNWDLVNYLELGRRLEQPPHTPDKIYQVMQECWKLDSSLRPEFSELVKMLDDCLKCIDSEIESELYLTPIQTNYDYAYGHNRGLPFMT